MFARGAFTGVSRGVYRDASATTPPNTPGRILNMRTPSHPRLKTCSSLNQQTSWLGDRRGIGRTPKIIEPHSGRVKPLLCILARLQADRRCLRKRKDEYPELRNQDPPALLFLVERLRPFCDNFSKFAIPIWQPNCSIICIAEWRYQRCVRTMCSSLCCFRPSPKEPNTHSRCGRRIECSFPPGAFSGGQ